jgi:hypothetical protein
MLLNSEAGFIEPESCKGLRSWQRLKVVEPIALGLRARRGGLNQKIKIENTE